MNHIHPAYDVTTTTAPLTFFPLLASPHEVLREVVVENLTRWLVPIADNVRSIIIIIITNVFRVPKLRYSMLRH